MSAHTHFRHRGRSHTLCGILDVPHYVEGGEDAVSFFKNSVVLIAGTACPICADAIKHPERKVESPDFEFLTVCHYCEEADDHIDEVAVVVRMDDNCVYWMRCSRCGCGRPCSEDTALEAWREYRRCQSMEARDCQVEHQVMEARWRDHR